MAKKKYPSRLETGESLTKDNLQLINGVGPTVEKRLNGIGINTFPQLAALSPADIAAAIADLSGLSAERIIKQDWVGQARKLAAGKVELHVEAPASIETTATIERNQAATQFVVPEHAHELAAETLSDVAHENVEVSAEPERDVRKAIPDEPPTSTEHALSAPLFLESEVPIVPSAQQHRSVTFTVEFLLDTNNNVSSTHVLHNQSGRKHTWTGWQKTQLVDFMSESVGLNVRSNEPAVPVAEEVETVTIEQPDLTPDEIAGSRLATSPVSMSRLSGMLHLRELEVIGVKSGGFHRTLIQNEPFDVQLTLDLAELEILDNSRLNYKTTIYGRGQGRSGLVVGKSEGSIIPTDKTTIMVKGNILPEGIYRLVAKVTVRQQDTKLTTKSSTSGVIDGGVVQVY